MKSRIIDIDGRRIGITGIDEIFERFRVAGRRPGPGIEENLLEAIGASNYVPPARREAYGRALRVEYERFLESGGRASPGRGTWWGIPREEIPWFPEILDDLCDGCGACVTFCPNGVYERGAEGARPVVANPYRCVVGCRNCAGRCRPRAILFPPREILKGLRE